MSLSDVVKESLWNAEFAVFEYYLDSMESFLELMEQAARKSELENQSTYLGEELTRA